MQRCSASAQANNTEIDLQGVNGDADAAAVGIPLGAELMRFAEALSSRDFEALKDARAALLAAAEERVLVDAAGVAGNFQRMVRIADAIGIPTDDVTTESILGLRDDLDLYRFASAENTRRVSGT